MMAGEKVCVSCATKFCALLVFPYGEARHTGAPRRQRVDLRELVERVPEA